MPKTFAVALLASTMSVGLAQAAATFSAGMARHGGGHACRPQEYLLSAARDKGVQPLLFYVPLDVCDS